MRRLLRPSLVQQFRKSILKIKTIYNRPTNNFFIYDDDGSQRRRNRTGSRKNMNDNTTTTEDTRMTINEDEEKKDTEDNDKTEERYLILVEFVHRHLNFQMAELVSILETHGIRCCSNNDEDDNDDIRSSRERGNFNNTQHKATTSNFNNNCCRFCCTILPLPIPSSSSSKNTTATASTTTTAAAAAAINNKNRSFALLSFPMEEASLWSGFIVSSNDEVVQQRRKENAKFHPRITNSNNNNNNNINSSSLLSSSSTSVPLLSIADILYKCTLVKSVVELWGYSTIDLHDCAERSYRWLTTNNNSHTNNSSSSMSSSSSSLSYQQEYIWPTICNNKDRPWKFTIHTLGTKVSRETQDTMRQSFRQTLDCLMGSVNLSRRSTSTNIDMHTNTKIDTTNTNTITEEFLLIREIRLDSQGSPMLLQRTTTNTNATNGNEDENNKLKDNDSNKTNPTVAVYNTDAIAYYFGRVLGGRDRSKNDGSRGLEQYSLKARPYLGPTSMDAELSFVMTSLGKVTAGTIVYDPFVGTGSILLSCALRGAYCMGSDIDIRVLRGKGGTQTIYNNFEYYQLPRPELIRTDNALYHRHYRHHHHHPKNNENNAKYKCDHHPVLYDAILCDPPYGIRAGARKSGSKHKNPNPIREENRHDHIAQTKPYQVSDVMSDLLDVAARTLKVHGRLVYIIPSYQQCADNDNNNSIGNNNDNDSLPRHECLELKFTCYQPFTNELGRRIVTMEKIGNYDETKREHYMASVWKHGHEAENNKCANIRQKLIDAAKKKPGYEQRNTYRKEKRKANKEAKKMKKRHDKRVKEEEKQEEDQQEQVP